MHSADPHWTARVDALLEAARDVQTRPRPEPRSSQIPSSHRELSDRYVRDMRQAMRGADAWWHAMVTTQMQGGLDRSAAERAVRRRYPIGRCVNRGVIATLRRYWLACEEINKLSLASGNDDGYMRPEYFVLGVWVDSPFSDLAEFISHLPYWPLGMDAQGQWI